MQEKITIQKNKHYLTINSKINAGHFQSMILSLNQKNLILNLINIKK